MKRRYRSCTRYDVPQLRCVEMVETYAASRPATIKPRNPDGRNVSIAG